MTEESQFIYHPQILDKSVKIANKTRKSTQPADSSSNPEGEDPSIPDVFSHLYAHGQAHKEKRSQMSQTLIDKECTFRPTLVSQQIEREPDIDKLVNSKQVFRDTLENVK